MNGLLQVILTLASDPKALSLNRHSHLFQVVTHTLAELLGELLTEPLAKFHHLLHPITTHSLSGLEIKNLERKVALGGFSAKHIFHRLQGHIAGGGNHHLGLLQLNLGAGIFEVVAIPHIAAHLIERVHQLLTVEIRHHIEGVGAGHVG